MTDGINDPIVQPLADEKYLAAVIALHDEIRTNSPTGYLAAKPPEYFRDLLSGRGGVLLGTIIDGSLAGFVVVVIAPDLKEACSKHHITYPDADGRIARDCGQGSVATVQSLCVETHWRGRNIASNLIKAAVGWAEDHGCVHLLTQVASDNVASWMRFLGCGFAIVGYWQHGHQRFLLRKIA